MAVNKRRQKIIQVLEDTHDTITASELGDMFGVSRQVIVNDIAFIREMGYEVISTNRGYLLRKEKGITKVVRVTHDYNRTKEELYAIVDAGGEILDVYVMHNFYGKISTTLNIRNRKEVDEFIFEMENKQMSYLNSLTNGVHFHTIWAESEKDIQAIERKLEELGFIY